MASRRAANADMLEGYWDGYDLECPEPNANRSHSYRHGFMNGRADKTGIVREYLSVDALDAKADAAMAADDAATLDMTRTG